MEEQSSESESLESNSNELQQNSDDFADNYLLQSDYSMSQLAGHLPFSAATPHSLSEFRNAGFSGSNSVPTPMTGPINLSSTQLKKSVYTYLDCRQNNQNTNSPDPMAGVFSSISAIGSNIYYNNVANNGTAGVEHVTMGSWLDFTAGSNSYAIATQSSTTISNYSFSMEVWISPDNFSSGNFNTQAVMYRGGNGLKGDIATLNTGKVRFRWSGSDSGLQSSSTLSAGTWYHVVGIYHVYNYVAQSNAANSGIAAIFINGSLDNSVSLSGIRVITTSGGSTNLMSFGFYNAGNSTSLSNNFNPPTYNFSYDGKMGHVRFYDGALPPAKVLQNYNATKGTYGYGNNSGSVFV